MVACDGPGALAACARYPQAVSPLTVFAAALAMPLPFSTATFTLAGATDGFQALAAGLCLPEGSAVAAREMSHGCFHW